LVLACIGIYGITAYTVARRTSEIGIRMALGAQRTSVLGLILGDAMVQLGLGLGIGIPVALAGGRLLGSQLYGIKSYDPMIFASAAALLAFCSALAGFLPARRAMRVDAAVALRAE
jgi:ABC-type antimicrobial peptide transport system permease subunit